MADIVDRADQDAEIHMALALQKRKPTLPATGQCYYCFEPLKTGVFCDHECSADYEQLQRMKK